MTSDGEFSREHGKAATPQVLQATGVGDGDTNTVALARWTSDVPVVDARLNLKTSLFAWCWQIKSIFMVYGTIVGIIQICFSRLLLEWYGSVTRGAVHGLLRGCYRDVTGPCNSP